ncbi:MAG TPA: hypothetical protein VGQ75_03555 [Thermoanaerobaculia bacterium]|nr:hypothetical protein [Thermoanaerobaculia bacterium]
MRPLNETAAPSRPQGAALRKRFWSGSGGVAFLFSLLVVAVYADPLLSRRNFAGRDLLPYNYPLEKSIHDAYSRGRLPVWTPEISGGRPLLPNPNAGALYPLRPILGQLHFPLAMRLYPILHWIAAGAGMIVLLGSLQASRSGRWVGAVTYVFSGVAVAEVFLPHLPGMALLPWIVWAVHSERLSDGVRLLLVSVFFGLLFLAADVFTIGIGLAAAPLWITLERPHGRIRRDLVMLLVSVLLGALLAAPQIVASALWIPETNRAVFGMRLADSFFLSISPFRLIEFLVPYPFGATWALDLKEIWRWPVFRYHAFGLFTTLYAGAFVVMAVVASQRWHAAGVSFARVLLLLTLAASVIPSLLPEKWLEIPSVIPLRNPEKFAMGLTFALAILAGLGLDHFRRVASTPRWTLWIAGLLALIAAATALFPEQAGRAAIRLTGVDSRFAPIAAFHLPGALAEGGLLWAATLVALDLHRRPRAATLVVSLLLLTAVPLVANRKIARTMREEDVFAPSPFARFLYRADPPGRFRVLGESLYQPPSRLANTQPMPVAREAWTFHGHGVWGRGTVFNHDFDAGDLARVESLRRLALIATRYRDSQAFYGTLALRWGIRFADQKPLAGYREIRRSGLEVWDELPGALPDVRLLESWREETGALTASTSIPGLRLGEVVLETGTRRAGRARPGRLRVLEDAPELLVVETETVDPGWVFVLRGFWSYRSVSLDGRPAEAVPAQVGFSAVRVPEGQHRIEWREEVPGLAVSRWGPVASIALLALLLLRERRQRSTR